MENGSSAYPPRNLASKFGDGPILDYSCHAGGCKPGDTTNWAGKLADGLGVSRERMIACDGKPLISGSSVDCGPTKDGKEPGNWVDGNGKIITPKIGGVTFTNSGTRR